MPGPPITDPFAVAERSLGPHRHLMELSGMIDLHTGSEVKRRLLWAVDGGANEVIVDLGDATHLDSTGLGVLLSVSKRLAAVGGRMIVVNHHPAITRVFEITGLDTLFTIVTTRRAAIERLDRRTP